MESPAPVSLFLSQSSKKRMFLAESSSSGCNEADELELSPPINRNSKPKSSKEDIHETIDVDMDGESEEVVLTDHEVDSSAKGKEVISNESGDDVDEDASSDQYYEEDDDTYYDDMLYEEEPATLESHFDHMDLPPGVEVSFPWLEGSPENETKVPLASTSIQASTNLQSDQLQPEYSQITDLSTIWGKSVADNKTGKGKREKKPTQIPSAPLYPAIVAGSGSFPTFTLKMSEKVNELGSLSALGSMDDDIDDPFFTGLAQDPAENLIGASQVETTAVPAKAAEPKSLVEVLRNFENFKKFDVVEDYSDHHYAKKGSSDVQLPKNWAKRIQEEWKILQKDLPIEVFVRVYEARMDLLRAVIIGAEGTPYHGGLYFFDVYFPSSYPNVPPLVHYHSRGLRINPNLYNCGKVCLSLLNTWGGGEKEKWIPGVSTMLQVLVSIQGLILNAKPYFNEPGFVHMDGTYGGEQQSAEYNERIFMYNLQTMGYNMRRPPKHFEDFTVGYFCKNGRNILLSCKAYLAGAKVGSLVKGRVRNVDAFNTSCSSEFKSSLALFMITLIHQFRTIGAKDCEEFLYMPELEKERETAANKPASGPLAKDFFK